MGDRNDQGDLRDAGTDLTGLICDNPVKISNEVLVMIKFLMTATNLRTGRVNVGKREAEVCNADNKNTS